MFFLSRSILPIIFNFVCMSVLAGNVNIDKIKYPNWSTQILVSHHKTNTDNGANTYLLQIWTRCHIVSDVYRIAEVIPRSLVVKVPTLSQDQSIHHSSLDGWLTQYRGSWFVLTSPEGVTFNIHTKVYGADKQQLRWCFHMGRNLDFDWCYKRLRINHFEAWTFRYVMYQIDHYSLVYILFCVIDDSHTHKGVAFCRN